MTPEQKQWLDRGFRRLSSDDDRLCVDRRTGIAALSYIDKLERERDTAIADREKLHASRTLDLIKERDALRADRDALEIERLMAQAPAWAVGFPIGCEGWAGRRYRK